MRIVFLGNNRVALEVVKWLREQGEEIVALVVHAPEKQKCGPEIIQASGLDRSRVFDARDLNGRQTLQALQALEAEVALSVFFGYIVKAPFLELFPRGCLNLHPALLPFNRGAYPNVWSIVERTPAGATLHYIDEGIDTGDIVAQREVPVEAVDSGETLYGKLERACVELFVDTWPVFKAGKASRTAQARDSGSFHRTSDVEKIDCIDLDRSYTGRQLIDILRARTFGSHPGAYFMSEGRKVFLRLQLGYGEDGAVKR
jgi:methionyl-tRNA formyltransferase